MELRQRSPIACGTLGQKTGTTDPFSVTIGCFCRHTYGYFLLSGVLNPGTNTLGILRNNLLVN